jgi:hypothetical protein
MAALTSLISGCDTFWEQARTSAKHHEHSIDGYVRYKSVQSIKINQLNILVLVAVRPVSLEASEERELERQAAQKKEGLIMRMFQSSAPLQRLSPQPLHNVQSAHVQAPVEPVVEPLAAPQQQQPAPTRATSED